MVSIISFDGFLSLGVALIPPNTMDSITELVRSSEAHINNQGYPIGNPVCLFLYDVGTTNYCGV
jgi:hypothetical protein